MSEENRSKKLGIWLTKGSGSWLVSKDGQVFGTDDQYVAAAQLDALKLPKDRAMIRTFEAWIEWRERKRQAEAKRLSGGRRNLMDGDSRPVHDSPSDPNYYLREGECSDPVPD